MSIQIQFRRDTAANWTSVNPTLAEGEIGYETDTGQIKFGDGINAWTLLPYKLLGVGGFNVTINVSTGYIQTGVAFRFRAPYNFQPESWFLSSVDSGSIVIEVLRSASAWPTVVGDSICNGAAPALVSTDNDTGSATTWDAVNEDDYIAILVYSTTTLEDVTLQVMGSKF